MLGVIFLAVFVMAFWIRRSKRYDFLWYINWNHIPSKNREVLFLRITSVLMFYSVFSLVYFALAPSFEWYSLSTLMVYMFSSGVIGLYIFVLHEYYQKPRV